MTGIIRGGGHHQGEEQAGISTLVEEWHTSKGAEGHDDSRNTTKGDRATKKRGGATTKGGKLPNNIFNQSFLGKIKQYNILQMSYRKGVLDLASLVRC